MPENVNVTADATATPTATPAPATQDAHAAPVATATPFATPAPAATPQVPDGYIPSSVLRYRLEETREAARQEAAQEMAELRAQYEATQLQLHRLVGATPQGDPEIDAVRQQFGNLYPGLSKLDKHADRIEALLERAGDLETQNKHYWQSYGRQNMDRLFEKAAQTYGAPLDDEAKRALHAAFSGHVSSSPELATRYANDPTVVDEFWNNFTARFIDPVRRVTSANVAGRISGALPQDTPSGAPRATPVPQPANLDERASLGWQSYLQNARK